MIEAVLGTWCVVLAADILALVIQKKRWYEERRSFLDVDAGSLADPEEAQQYLSLPLERMPHIEFLGFLGAGFFGKAWLCRTAAGHHAAKAARLECPLGPARARQELMTDAVHAVQVPQHPALCAVLGWCWHGGTPYVLWELVPSSWGVCIKTVLQSHYTHKSSPLLQIMCCLADVLMHLNRLDFPLFDPHSCDIMVNHVGNIKILDWSGGFSPDSGNCCLLPRAFLCGPAEREELVRNLGSKAAAQMVNCSVMAFYLGAVCAAAEANVTAAVMEQISLCQVHPGPKVSNMMWKMAVRSLMLQEIRIEDLVTQHNPVQLNLRIPG